MVRLTKRSVTFFDLLMSWIVAASPVLSCYNHVPARLKKNNLSFNSSSHLATEPLHVITLWSMFCKAPLFAEIDWGQ